MANALKAINTRVKQLQKKHPKTKRTTLQKQAGREWKSGKLSGKSVGAKKKKAAPRKKVAKKTKPAKSKFVAIKQRTGKQKKLKAAVVVYGVKKRRRRKPAKAKLTYRARRVSGSGKPSIMPLLLLAGAGILAYTLMKPATPVYPPITLQNPQTAGTANSIVQYAAAAGAGITAITKLISQLNSSSDAQVSYAASQLQSTGALPSSFSLADDLSANGALNNPTPIDFGI